MPTIGFNIKPRGYSGGVVVGQYTLGSAAYVSGGIYRTSDNVLLRTLFAAEYQSAGVQYIYWDGLDDKGNDVSATPAYFKYLKNNVVDDWGTIGNSATLDHGVTTFSGYSPHVNMAIDGDNVYIGEGWNEGARKAALKVDKSVDINAAIGILTDYTGNNTNLSTEYVCTDGTNVYWGGTYVGTDNSWVFATKVSDDTEVTFSSGTAHQEGSSRSYASVLSLVTADPTNLITGLTTDGTYLWVARGSQNEIEVYSCSTGALLTTIATFTNPRKLHYDSLQGGRVWFLNSTNTITKGIIGVNGDLTTGTLTGSVVGDKINIAVDPLTAKLAIITGGTNQQIYLYDVTALNPVLGSPTILGQTGGYQSTAISEYKHLYLLIYRLYKLLYYYLHSILHLCKYCCLK